MFHKVVLENGIRVVSFPMPEMRSVSVGLWIEAGSRHENLENNGISHFIEHLLFKGTEKRSAKKIAEIFDSIGGQINAFTGKEATCFYTKTLSKYLELSIDVLSDIFFHSLINPSEMELEKSVVIEEIHMYEDSPEEIVHDLVTELAWKKSLGYPILGTLDNIQNMTRKDIVDYKNLHYTPNRVVIAVAGNYDEKKLDKLIRKYFADWKADFSKVTYEENLFHAGEQFVEKDTEQAHFCISYPGLKSKDDLTYSALALNNILGGGMSSRLFQEIREKRGLAYSVYTYVTSYKEEGLFTIYGGINPENYTKVMALLNAEIEKIFHKQPSAREIKNAKEQLKGNFLLGLENTTSIMSYIGKSELLWNEIETFEEVIEKIEKIDDESIGVVKEKIFAEGETAKVVIGEVEA
ncbi:MAG: insulinase family protein [Clostridia bacterium]|nr:insulinase family protein [Clostridia bacterium]